MYRLILGLRPANERRRYFVTTSLIGWAQAWNQPWCTLCRQPLAQETGQLIWLETPTLLSGLEGISVILAPYFNFPWYILLHNVGRIRHWHNVFNSCWNYNRKCEAFMLVHTWRFYGRKILDWRTWRQSNLIYRLSNNVNLTRVWYTIAGYMVYI